MAAASQAVHRRLHWHRLLCDVTAGIFIALPLEAIGLRSGVWDYNYLLQWTWGTMPVIGMPYEALTGYALLMLVAPTYVRHWGQAFPQPRNTGP